MSVELLVANGVSATLLYECPQIHLPQMELAHFQSEQIDFQRIKLLT